MTNISPSCHNHAEARTRPRPRGSFALDPCKHRASPASAPAVPVFGAWERSRAEFLRLFQNLAATPSLQPARLSFRAKPGPARTLGATLSPCLETGIPASRTRSRDLGNHSPGVGFVIPHLGKWFRGLGIHSPGAGFVFPHLGICCRGLGIHSPGLGKRSPGLATVSPGIARMYSGHDTEFRDMGKGWTGLDTSSRGLGNDSPGVGTKSPGLGKRWRGLGNQSPSLGKGFLGLGRRFSHKNGFWSFLGRACAGSACPQEHHQVSWAQVEAVPTGRPVGVLAAAALSAGWRAPGNRCCGRILFLARSFFAILAAWVNVVRRANAPFNSCFSTI